MIIDLTLSEDDIRKAIVRWLREQGWALTVDEIELYTEIGDVGAKIVDVARRELATGRD